MNYVDCENYSSTLESISRILDIPVRDIVDHCATEDYAFKFEDENIFRSKDFSQYIYDSFIEKFRVIPKDIHTVYWFHLSRTMQPESFMQKGILPLSQAFPLLCPSKIRTYHHDLFREGPFAMLVKDVAFHPSEIGNHDYLRVPEIIEDIGLEKAYAQKAFPVIVKFRAEAEFSPEFYLKPMLNYIYCTIRGMDFSLNCNTCFDAKGHIIEPEKIVYVEKIKENIHADT